MSIKIGINGFGRIGRNIFRALSGDPAFADIEVVGINDLTDVKTIAQLLKYDSIMGRSAQDIKAGENALIVDGREIPLTSHRNPAEIPGQALALNTCWNAPAFLPIWKRPRRILMQARPRLLFQRRPRAR